MMGFFFKFYGNWGDVLYVVENLYMISGGINIVDVIKFIIDEMFFVISGVRSNVFRIVILFINGGIVDS